MTTTDRVDTDKERSIATDEMIIINQVDSHCTMDTCCNASAASAAFDYYSPTIAIQWMMIKATIVK
jgi:hypothetical protein